MRKLVWFTVGFAIACIAGAYFYSEYLLLFMLGALLLCAAGFIGMRFKRGFRVAAAVFLGMGIGLAAFMLHDTIRLAPIRALDGQTCQLSITADDYSFQTQYGCAAEGTLKHNGRDYNIRIYLNEDMELSPGDVVSGSFALRFTADGNPDTSPLYRGKGIFLTASQISPVEISKDADFEPRHYPALWRRALQEKIDASFPKDVTAIVKGLLLGDRSGMDYETETAFKVSGISHIVAVSGLHISILFALVSFLTLRRRWITALIGIPVLVAFAAVAGFTPSVTRACIMYILMLLSWLFMREYDPPTELAFSALVMLALNPFTITSVSFQLSMACMVGIYLISGKLRSWILDPKRLGNRKGILGRLLNGIASSISITLGSIVFTTPLCAYYFGTVSIVGIFTNLLTLWAVSVAFYGIVAVCIISFLSGGFAAVLGWIFTWVIRYVVCVAKLLGAIPFAAVYTRSVYIVIWLVLAYGIFGLFLLLKRKRPLILASVILATLALATAAGWIVPKFDSYRITVLDVGNGQSILLQAEGKTFVVDCGGDYDEGAANAAAETLLSQGITKIDGLILTHFDMDHSGGAAGLLTRVAADRVYVPAIDDHNGVLAKLTEISGFAPETVAKSATFVYGDCELTLFPAESRNSSNESSLCILFRTEKCDILITGDRSTAGELELIKRNDLPDIDVLIVGHHGAADSTGDLLLDEVKPEYAVISVGKSNIYGHPDGSVIDRLEKRGCRIYRTDVHGTIVFRG